MYIKNHKPSKTINFFDRRDNLWIEELTYKEAEELAKNILKEIKG